MSGEESKPLISGENTQLSYSTYVSKNFKKFKCLKKIKYI